MPMDIPLLTENLIKIGFAVLIGGVIGAEREFRGWGGSSHPDVTLSSEGVPVVIERAALPGDFLVAAIADGVFGEMHLILCRNVLIYFGDELQQRALRLFRDSLVRGGFLCLGDRERPNDTRFTADFRPLASGASVFRRVDGRA